MADTSEIELLDMYDKNGNKTGIIRKRSEPMEDEEYHRIVHVWIKNSDNKFLITKRSPEKNFCPDMWECPGGFVVSGEESAAAALREVKEETGITLTPDKGELISSFTEGDYLKDIWLFNEYIDIKNAVLQESETCGIKFASKDDIVKMIGNREFVLYVKYIYDLL
ncbi:MAG: NUDIX domain-containing protein [Oscillospiraceae bacterium]|nr:NUDIX domain-containing protein [Oscillospiraceae bacterium]